MSATQFHYQRRRPERTTLYEVVRDNLATLEAASAQGFASPLPSFVKRELEGYLECGLFYALAVTMRGLVRQVFRFGVRDGGGSA